MDMDKVTFEQRFAGSVIIVTYQSETFQRPVSNICRGYIWEATFRKTNGKTSSKKCFTK